jgi:AcrR family transcriptional regulator
MRSANGDDYRRQRRLQATADYLLEHGLGELSLRPLAAALGTSARMLVYYFGSKEELLVEALTEVRRRQYVDLYREEATGGPLRQYWQWASSDSRRGYLKLLYELYGDALRDPEAYGGLLKQEGIDWQGFCEAGYRQLGLKPRDATALAAYTMAAVRGLEVDLLATGDRDRANATFEMFAEDVEQRIAKVRKPSRSAR